MILKLTNGVLRIADGDIGAQYSANVRVTVDSDLSARGYIHALLVRYQAEDGSTVDGICPRVGNYFSIPAAAYKTTQCIMLTVASTKDDETVNSRPLYVQIKEGSSGGADILPADEQTWQTLVRAYVDTLMSATNEKILQVEGRLEAVEQNGGGTGGSGLSDELKQAWRGHLTEVAYASASHPYTDALYTLLGGEDIPVTPPKDEPDEPPVDEPTETEVYPSIDRDGYYITGGGTVTAYDGWAVSNMIDVSSCNQIVVSVDANASSELSSTYQSWYDSDGKRISKISESIPKGGNRTFDVPSNAHYIMFSSDRNDFVNKSIKVTLVR